MQYVEMGDPDSLRLSCAAQSEVKGVPCEAMYSTGCNSGSRRGQAGVVVSLPVTVMNINKKCARSGHILGSVTFIITCNNM